MKKITVTISEVEKIENQTHVKYEGHGVLGNTHPDFKNAKVGQVYEIEIDTARLQGGTEILSVKLIQ